MWETFIRTNLEKKRVSLDKKVTTSLDRYELGVEIPPEILNKKFDHQEEANRLLHDRLDDITTPPPFSFGQQPEEGEIVAE